MKEQVAKLIQKYSVQPYTGANEIHSLYMARFKEVVDKLTVIDDEEILRVTQDTCLRTLGEQIPVEHISLELVKPILTKQLQDTKKQLLDLMGE